LALGEKTELVAPNLEMSVKRVDNSLYRVKIDSKEAMLELDMTFNLKDYPS